MARQINQIDSFSFIRLECPTLARAQKIMRIERPGVDGIAILRIGRQGGPYTFKSFVDVPTLQDGWMEYERYRQLIGGDGVPIVWASAIDVRVAVLDVQPIGLKPCKGAIGGLHPPSLGILICQWTLEMLSS